MMVFSTVFFSVYGVLTLTGLYFRQVHVKKQRLLTKGKNRIQLSNVSLIIPFRNEEMRIEPLLNSILASTQLPKNIVFVDDHSDDESVALIHSKLVSIDYTLLKSDCTGKKAALNHAINSVETQYVLTMDADVHFPANYFEGIATLHDADMQVLPVKMESNSWKLLLEMDVYLINSLNAVADGISHPIVASGANLLFNRQAYLNVHSLAEHQDIASGDDQFLLRDFNKNKLQIVLSTYRNITISTPAPNSVREFLMQRFRWIAKSPKVNDSLATKIGIIQVLTTLLFGWIFFQSIVESNYAIALMFLLLKTLLDGILAHDYLKKIGKTNCLLILPIYEILLPFYTTFLSLLLPFYRPQWKGRKM